MKQTTQNLDAPSAAANHRHTRTTRSSWLDRTGRSSADCVQVWETSCV